MDRETDSAAGEKAQASTPEPSTEAEDPRPRVTWGAGSTPKSKKEPIPKWIWAAIGVTLLLVASFGVYAAERSKNQQDAAAVVTTTTTLSPEVERRRYMGSSRTVEYRRLAKRSGDYLGVPLLLGGEVVQIMEDSSGTTMRLAVTKTDRGYDYNDIVFTIYPDSMEGVFEEDIVRIWGDGGGDYTYTSQAGWQITVPAVFVRYWQKVR